MDIDVPSASFYLRLSRFPELFIDGLGVAVEGIFVEIDETRNQGNVSLTALCSGPLDRDLREMPLREFLGMQSRIAISVSDPDASAADLRFLGHPDICKNRAFIHAMSGAAWEEIGPALSPKIVREKVSSAALT
ncbi:hypothetical protein ELI01_09050 [Rhizobium leguminosarum]|uniref:hypothetical protein n=1 Tax=Rhizobium leguminosarum TaxID=384 RepID=UPI0010308D60|nr:hypothetical protein [Rhizobium leguminosarum]TAX55366.1 hypothetical protein ELI01_09050 [Rhizobium leguminosarum]